MKPFTLTRLSLILATVASLVVLAILVDFRVVHGMPSTMLLVALPVATFLIFLLLTRVVLKLFGRSEMEKMKGLESYRREFMGNVYHELKTPVFNLQGYIMTLVDGGMDDPSINKLYLERSVKNINRMISIVEDLESISRLEPGALKLTIGRFDMRRLVVEVFEANELKADSKKIKLQFAMPKEFPVMVRADRKRIYQVVNNIVINSLNYGKEGGRTRVSFTPAGRRVLVEIEDNGIGISAEELPRIFERFYRVDKSRSRDSGGTGLGLAIVKHIVEAHKQTVNVKSTPGKGSVFSFTLERG